MSDPLGGQLPPGSLAVGRSDVRALEDPLLCKLSSNKVTFSSSYCWEYVRNVIESGFGIFVVCNAFCSTGPVDIRLASSYESLTTKPTVAVCMVVYGAGSPDTGYLRSPVQTGAYLASLDISMLFGIGGASWWIPTRHLVEFSTSWRR